MLVDLVRIRVGLQNLATGNLPAQPPRTTSPHNLPTTSPNVFYLSGVQIGQRILPLGGGKSEIRVVVYSFDDPPPPSLHRQRN